MKNRGCPKTKGVRKHRVITALQLYIHAIHFKYYSVNTYECKDAT